MGRCGVPVLKVISVVCLIWGGVQRLTGILVAGLTIRGDNFLVGMEWKRKTGGCRETTTSKPAFIQPLKSSCLFLIETATSKRPPPSQGKVAEDTSTKSLEEENRSRWNSMSIETPSTADRPELAFLYLYLFVSIHQLHHSKPCSLANLTSALRT